MTKKEVIKKELQPNLMIEKKIEDLLPIELETKEESGPIKFEKRESIMNTEKIIRVKPDKLTNRLNFKLLTGNHIVLFLHRENNISYIIAKRKIKSLTESIRINNNEFTFKIETSKPTLIWGNMRLYLIDCESSQQVSLNSNEKVIDIKVLNDFCYREVLYKMTKNISKQNMQTISLLIGFVIGFALCGFLIMVLLYSGVL